MVELCSADIALKRYPARAGRQRPCADSTVCSSRKGTSDTAMHLRSAGSSLQLAGGTDRQALLAAASKCLNKQLQEVLPSGDPWPLHD